MPTDKAGENPRDKIIKMKVEFALHRNDIDFH